MVDSIDKIRLSFKHPKEVLKYLISRKENRVEEYKIDKYLSIYNSIKQENKKTSKHFIYFEFCKRILTDTIQDESLRNRFFNNLKQISESEIVSALTAKVEPKRLAGLDWPKRAHTMIGLIRLENLQFCVEDILKNNIPGDLIETGVWRGGACIFMRLILKKYGIKDKIVYGADSFEGVPKPNVSKYPKDANDIHHISDILKVSMKEVQNNFKVYGMLDDQVKFLKGWFKDSLKQPPFEKLSLLRLDGDMYSSTWESLDNLYHKLSVGGYLIVDDYALRGCRDAVDEFRLQNNIHESIEPIDGNGIFWKKQSKT